MHDAPKAPATDLRSYGRRHGRKLSPRQTHLLRNDLPKLSLDLASPAPEQLHRLFGPATKEICLEIGFGGGEHLIWQAVHRPDIGLIGCEPFLDGIVKVLSAIEARNLRNIRIYPDDAREVLRWLPDAVLSRAFILFPDPWPKKRHHKRRLVSPTLISMLGRVMKPGGELRIGTDIADYARTALLSVRNNPDFEWLASGPDDWRHRPADWPQTRYEQKALLAGRQCCFLRFRRR